MAVQAPSVTEMAQRLVSAGLIDYERYKGVRLTVQGEVIALKIIRRHRLIELYLVRELNYALKEVHAEAESLEHAVSDRFVEALATKLGDPALDPHGDPIPSADGTITRRILSALSQWPLDTPACVSRIIAENPAMVEHLLDRGFSLNATVVVLSHDPFEGPLTVRVEGVEKVIGHQAAACVLVEKRE